MHGSARVAGNALRRTIYYEFRAAEEILEDGTWDRAWINARMRLVPLALRRHAEPRSYAPQFAWNMSDTFRPNVSDDEQVELKIAHVAHMGGAFCSAGDAGKQ